MLFRSQLLKTEVGLLWRSLTLLSKEYARQNEVHMCTHVDVVGVRSTMLNMAWFTFYGTHVAEVAVC